MSVKRLIEFLRGPRVRPSEPRLKIRKMDYLIAGGLVGGVVAVSPLLVLGWALLRLKDSSSGAHDRYVDLV